MSKTKMTETAATNHHQGSNRELNSAPGIRFNCSWESGESGVPLAFCLVAVRHQPLIESLRDKNYLLSKPLIRELGNQSLILYLLDTIIDFGK